MGETRFAEMRIVLDTNVVISGFLWSGTPKEILGLVEERTVVICANQEIIAEMERVLLYPKLKDIVSQIGKTPRGIINEFLEIIIMFPPIVLAESSRLEDRTDEKFLSCAVTADAAFIVSGDKHLLRLKTFRGVDIVSPNDFLRRFKTK